MADKTLKSITFPVLGKYIIPKTTVDATPTQGSTNAVSSGGVYSALADKADKDRTPETATPTETDADFYVCDSNGNVIAEFVDGHIRTKNFDSSDINTDTDTTLSVQGKPADAKAVGDALANIEPSSKDVMSKESTAQNVPLDISDTNGNVLVRFQNGHIHTEKFHSETVNPTIITVKADGTGDFTSLRSAVESITNASADINPYIIEIYEGTYNILADYSDAEITASGFQGLVVTDGISLKGVGIRENIVLHGELSTDYSSDIRNNVSTLNLVDTMSMENLTVTARNIRYCVHDDSEPTKEYYNRHVKNCRFRIYSPTSGTQQKTWGEGARRGKTTVLEDCDFGTFLLWHSDNQYSATRGTKLIVKNCTATFASISVYNHSVKHQVFLYNNNFSIIYHNFVNVSSTNRMMDVFGTGKGAMTEAPADYNYTNGDIVRFRRDGNFALQVGQLVIPSTAPYWIQGAITATADKDVAYGVIVGLDDDWAYVQTDGYININRFGFSGLSVGDKITVTNSGLLEVNGSGETYGVVCCVTNSYGTYMRRI